MIADSALPGRAIFAEPGTMAQTLDLAAAGTVGRADQRRPFALAARSHAGVLDAASVLLYGLLLFAWVVVGARTIAGAASGRLFAPGAAISRALST